MRSERQLVEQIDLNLLFRRVVRLPIDDRIWDHSIISHNPNRLFDEGLAHQFFERVKLTAEWQELISDERFRRTSGMEPASAQFWVSGNEG